MQRKLWQENGVFANLKDSELESALISHLEEFLLELGRGFAFIGRQKRITIDGQHFYPDLVFYNVLTHSYVIIDLKMKHNLIMPTKEELIKEIEITRQKFKLIHS